MEEHKSRTHFSEKDISICPHHTTCDSIPPSAIIFTKRKEREREREKLQFCCISLFLFLLHSRSDNLIASANFMTKEKGEEKYEDGILKINQFEVTD